jgi:broad specificity phosphatase PhoE
MATTVDEWFLIRHGLSGASSRRQRPETGLGPDGRWQARQAAEHKLSQHRINHLFASPLARATETANIIGKILRLPPVILRDLREMERPISIYGARHSASHNLKYKNAWKTALDDLNLNWKHEGEGESMGELLLRVDNLHRQLSHKYPGEKIAIVGHAVQLAFFQARITLGDEATPVDVVQLAKRCFLRHGGLAHLRFEEGRWNLVHFDRSSK